LDFFPADSPPVGLVDPEVFNTMLQKRTLEVKLNDVIIQYSDGVLEGMNVAKDLYGEERFNESIRKNGHLPIQKIIDNTKADLFAFTKGATQNDDITLIGVKVVG
ncbi:MAG: SpoIIE family protein phosphatase, partial [Spirochaetes bacterium]|nr:SpoIIE family protein phosphatase [Spirochaetota bacterium]